MASIQSNINLSVVIISYKRIDALKLCLNDFANQKTKYSFEVVLVLQGYPSGTGAELFSLYSNFFPITIKEYDYGLGVHGARNVGLRLASREIIAFQDDDCRINSDWVEKLLPHYVDPTIGGIGGFVNHPEHMNGCRDFFYRALGITSSHYKIDWGGFSSAPSYPTMSPQRADWLSGGNCSYRRKVYDQVGNYDESYGKYGYDDVDFGLRASRAGWTLVVFPELTVDHYPNVIARAQDEMRSYLFNSESSRVLLVRKAIGHKPAWIVRYFLRYTLYLPATIAMALFNKDPLIPFFGIAGAFHGLRRFWNHPPVQQTKTQFE